MDKVQDGLHTPEAMAPRRSALHSLPVSKPCSDKIALCMAVPAITMLLLGFWWLGML